MLAYRELDDALGLTEMAEGVFHDSRTGKNGWHGITGQFRQSVFGRLGGYDDVNDADRLGRDCPFYKLRPAQKPWYFECPSHWLGWLPQGRPVDDEAR